MMFRVLETVEGGLPWLLTDKSDPWRLGLMTPPIPEDPPDELSLPWLSLGRPAVLLSLLSLLLFPESTEFPELSCELSRACLKRTLSSASELPSTVRLAGCLGPPTYSSTAI